MSIREDDRRWAKFFAEDRGVDMKRALQCAVVYRMLLATPTYTLNNEGWVGHGKVRIYFDFMSQNNLPSIDGMQKAYYDADDDEIYVERRLAGVTWRDTLADLAGKKHCFSGARTRRWVHELAGRFYHETWARH